MTTKVWLLHGAPFQIHSMVVACLFQHLRPKCVIPVNCRWLAPNRPLSFAASVSKPLLFGKDGIRDGQPGTHISWWIQRVFISCYRSAENVDVGGAPGSSTHWKAFNRIH